MAVGEDVAVLVHHEAGAQRPLRLGVRPTLRALALRTLGTEEAVEHVVAEEVAEGAAALALDELLGVDVDDTSRHAVRDVPESLERRRSERAGGDGGRGRLGGAGHRGLWLHLRGDDRAQQHRGHGDREKRSDRAGPGVHRTRPSSVPPVRLERRAKIRRRHYCKERTEMSCSGQALCAASRGLVSAGNIIVHQGLRVSRVKSCSGVVGPCRRKASPVSRKAGDCWGGRGGLQTPPRFRRFDPIQRELNNRPFRPEASAPPSSSRGCRPRSPRW